MATQGRRTENTQLQDEIKLLRLENEFYRTRSLVCQSGIELKAIRARIDQELYDIEAQHRKNMISSFSEKIVELEVSLCMLIRDIRGVFWCALIKGNPHCLCSERISFLGCNVTT